MAKYVHPLYALRERMKGYEVSVMKEAMEMLGMPAGPVRPPLTKCRAQDVDGSAQDRRRVSGEPGSRRGLDVIIR